MARPQIEFVQSQSLSWRPDDRFGLGEGVELKILSEDPDDGSVSMLVRYPPGWRLPAGARGADEEFLVIDGVVSVGGTDCGYLSYGHWPAGYSTGARQTDAGAVVLTFFSADPLRNPPATFDKERLVEHIDAFTTPYTGNFHPEFPPGAGRKVLFTDPVTQETSWILGTLPVRWAERAEEHDHVEEMYLLSGENHGDRGVMRPGAYFWRPGLIPHGPYGTMTGNLYFFRTKGGPLVTRYATPKTPFHWWPSYDPALPSSFGAKPMEGAPTSKPW